MTVALAPAPVFQGVGFGGLPLPGGKLFTYEAGTNTPQASYTDSTQLSQNTNPVILNANGQANVWLVVGFTYKLILQDFFGNQIWSVDNIPGGISLNLTQQSLGLILYPQTPAEIAANVIPVNFFYPPGTVFRYGTNAIPGTTDMTAVFIAMWAQAAQIGGADCYVPPGTYLHNSTFGAYPANVKTRGGGRNITQILKGFNGNTFSNIGSYAQFESLWFSGNGANSFTGNWGTIPAGSQSQIVRDCQISDFKVGVSGGVVTFADTTAGSQIIFDSVQIWQTGGATGTNLYAFYVPDAVQLTAYPRHFHNIETQGFCAFFFGGSADTYISDSTFADLNYTANTRSVHVTNSRWLNQVSATINGHNNTITSCDLNPQLTIAAGADNNAIVGNSYNSLPVIDNSGNNRNLVEVFVQSYTPTLVSGGTIVNGIITGEFERHGADISFIVNYTVGSTDSLSGIIEFSLPQAKTSGSVYIPGNAVITHSGVQYGAILEIPGNVNYLLMLYQITGSALNTPCTVSTVTATAPITLGTGDTIRLSGTYSL